MQQVKQKIKDTTLFSDEDKISILAAMDRYAKDDITKLEAIIDEFDAAHRLAISEYKKSINKVLDEIVSKATPDDATRLKTASSTIQSGVDMLLQ